MARLLVCLAILVTFNPCPLSANDRFTPAITVLKQAVFLWNEAGLEQVTLDDLTASVKDGTPVIEGMATAFGQPVSVMALVNEASLRPDRVTFTFERGLALPLHLIRQLHPRALAALPSGIEQAAALESLELGIDDLGRVQSAVVKVAGASWRPVRETDFEIGPFSLSIEIDDPTGGRNAGLTAQLHGDASLAGIGGSVTGSIGSAESEWLLAASIHDLTIDRIIALVAGADDADKLGLPSALRELVLNQLSVTIEPAAKSFSVSADSSLGILQAGLTAGGTKRFFVGIQPPPDFRFASLDQGLKTLDAIGLQNSALVISSHQQVVDLPLFAEFGGRDVGRGLSVLAAWRIDQLDPQLATVMGKSQIVVQATIGTRLTDLALEGELDTDLRFDPAGSVSMRGVEISLRPAPQQAEIKLGGLLDVRASQNEVLTFKADVIVDVTNQGLEVDGQMIGIWQNALGIRGLHMGNAGIGGGLSFRTTPIPLPVFRLQGELIAGDIDRPDFSGDGLLALDASNPLQSAIDAGFDKLDLDQIIRAATAPNVYRDIPADIRNTVLKTSLKDVRLTVVPSPAGLVVFDKAYDPGFLVKGNGRIANLQADLLMALDYTAGIEARASVSPISHPPFFELTGARGQGWPILYLIAKPAERSLVAVSGQANVLGMASETDLYINDGGFSLYTSGRLFDSFSGSVEIAGGDLTDGGTIYAMAQMRNDLTQRITRVASRAIDEATRQTRRDMNFARSEIERAKGDVRRLDGDIARNRNIINAERQRDCGRIVRAERGVGNAQREVNRLQREIDLRHRWIADTPWVWEKARFGTEIVGLETAKATATAALFTARSALNGIGVACVRSPVDLDPRVSTLIAAKETALAAMTASQESLRGFEAIGVGTLTAAKWLNENASPIGVVNITDAHFEGCLNALSGGRVSMEIRGTFADKPIDGAFTMNLSSPDEAIREFANTLLRVGRAPQDLSRRGQCAKPSSMGAMLARGGPGTPRPATLVTALPN
jgi:hypothetical protein